MLNINWIWLLGRVSSSKLFSQVIFPSINFPRRFLLFYSVHLRASLVFALFSVFYFVCFFFRFYSVDFSMNVQNSHSAINVENVLNHHWFDSNSRLAVEIEWDSFFNSLFRLSRLFFFQFQYFVYPSVIVLNENWQKKTYRII